MYQLYIANKNYSSWSMRPWLVLKAFNLALEVMLEFPTQRNTGTFKQTVLAINPNGKVPVLVDPDRGDRNGADESVIIWDSLAICEYLAECHPELALWPTDLKQRVRARCIAAEMHSGFTQLRTVCGMNIRAHLPDVGMRLWQENEELRQDIARIEQIWAQRPDPTGFLCGEFSIADAFYAPVVMRLLTYALPLSESTHQYIQTLKSHPTVKIWCEQALNEQAWVNYLEPYQSSISK